jgi:hypothetical protein
VLHAKIADCGDSYKNGTILSLQNLIFTCGISFFPILVINWNELKYEPKYEQKNGNINNNDIF